MADGDDRLRPDISSHLVHLTRHFQGSEPRDNLVSICSTRCIEARTPYGVAVKHLDYIGVTDTAFKESQKVACFSEGNYALDKPMPRE